MEQQTNQVLPNLGNNIDIIPAISFSSIIIPKSFLCMENYEWGKDKQ